MMPVRWRHWTDKISMTTKGLVTFNSIGEYHKILNLPKPQHPLVSIIKFTGTAMSPYFLENKFVYDFYTISIKKNIKGTIRYGRQNYDFSEGIMSLSSPKQVFSFDESTDVSELSGWGLIFHSDFIRNYNLAKQIQNYGFFSYETHEALHLSEGFSKQKQNSLLWNSEIHSIKNPMNVFVPSISL